MIKPLLWIPVLLLLVLSSCDNKQDATPEPTPTTYDKEVTFHLFTEMDYRDARWEDSRMNLSFTLRRINRELQLETVVLDTTLGWMPFQQLPLQATKLQVVKKFKGMSIAQEDLVLHVSKDISINGNETVFTYSQTLDRTKPKEVVEIKL
jgi:hypothetical protein